VHLERNFLLYPFPRVAPFGPVLIYAIFEHVVADFLLAMIFVARGRFPFLNFEEITP